MPRPRALGDRPPQADGRPWFQDFLRLVEASGRGGSADLPGLREALLKGSGRSYALENWEHMTYTWALKDMQIVMDMCDRAGLSSPLLGHVKEQVKAAREIKRRGEVAWTR